MIVLLWSLDFINSPYALATFPILFSRDRMFASAFTRAIKSETIGILFGETTLFRCVK